MAFAPIQSLPVLSFEKQKTLVLAVPRQYMLSSTIWSNPGEIDTFPRLFIAPLKIWQDLAKLQNVPKIQITKCTIFILALSSHTLRLKKWKKTKRSKILSITGFLTYHRFDCIYLHIPANKSNSPQLKMTLSVSLERHSLSNLLVNHNKSVFVHFLNLSRGFKKGHNLNWCSRHTHKLPLQMSVVEGLKLLPLGHLYSPNLATAAQELGVDGWQLGYSI